MAEEPRRQLWRGPVEGWSTLFILLFMLSTVGWAVDDVRWAGYGAGKTSQTWFLPWAIVFGGLWGFVSAKAQRPALVAHVAGAILATAYLIFAVASSLSADPNLQLRVRALTESLDRFAYDLFYAGVRSAETSAFLLTLGVIAWGTGQFAAFSIFRRRRPLPAVLLTGLLLLVNALVTIDSQLGFLVLFATASLVLLLRLNLLDQQHAWARRRIAGVDEVSGVFMRGGLVFVSLTLVGSLVLATNAASAPLAGAWRDADDHLVRWGIELNRIAGGISGAARGPSGLFSSSQTIRGVWESSPELVFRARAEDGEGHYWRGATYDSFDGLTWQQLDRVGADPRPPGERLLGGTRDEVGAGAGRREVAFTVTSVDLPGDLFLAPDAPLTTDRSARIFTNDSRGPLVAIELTEPVRAGETYSVTALVRETAEPNGITENKLAAAGVSYPIWARRFVEIAPGSIGEVTESVAEEIVNGLPKDERDPYHIAQAIQDYFHSGRFRYSTDVRDLCGSEKLVECFLRTKVGYCEYFATAMVMLLRTQEIPARLAMGYLPGKKLPDGSWEIDRGAAHAWVEAYFPGYGWIRFDPTPGNRENGQTPTRLALGAPVATPPPDDPAAPRRTPRFDREDERDLEGRDEEEFATSGPELGNAPAGSRPVDRDQLQLVLIVMSGVAATVAGVGLRLRRAGPDLAPELAYRGVTRIAARLGHGPRPNQTAYEYAGKLAEVVPRVSGDLQLVAQAKVEATYAGRAHRADAVQSLRGAYRRIRVSLLRLALRRPPHFDRRWRVRR